ncbi:hypothetical protein [Cysteiniphilum sp. JM-1]|uniref:hypothetical protein n=1 Tax=Cysteiniphilum sp. JM-1 TaxID=2610891 RepID=UPI0012480767|nr:hypothetical protein [Cysteiniphilum sp. JM-1]
MILIGTRYLKAPQVKAIIESVINEQYSDIAQEDKVELLDDIYEIFNARNVNSPQIASRIYAGKDSFKSEIRAEIENRIESHPAITFCQEVSVKKGDNLGYRVSAYNTFDSELFIKGSNQENNWDGLYCAKSKKHAADGYLSTIAYRAYAEQLGLFSEKSSYYQGFQDYCENRKNNGDEREQYLLAEDYIVNKLSSTNLGRVEIAVHKITSNENMQKLICTDPSLKIQEVNVDRVKKHLSKALEIDIGSDAILPALGRKGYIWEGYHDYTGAMELAVPAVLTSNIKVKKVGGYIIDKGNFDNPIKKPMDNSENSQKILRDTENTGLEGSKASRLTSENKSTREKMGSFQDNYNSKQTAILPFTQNIRNKNASVKDNSYVS